MCSTVDDALGSVLARVGDRGEEILALLAVIDRAQALLVERVGQFDAAQEHTADGAYSAACWMRARSDLSRGDSLQLVTLARRLRTMPQTARAVTNGKLSVTKAALLAGVINDRTRTAFDDQEQMLVDEVQGLSVDEAKTQLDHWKRTVDTDGPDPSDPERNRASMHVEFNGRWRLEADLDPVNGPILKSVLQAIQDKLHHDGRFNHLTGAANTAARRMAEALLELANPNRGTVHPDVIVTIPASTILTERVNPFDPPTVIDSGPIRYDDAIRFAFLGTLSLLTIDDQGRPLNLGRKVRLATGDQWIAGAIWHRGCVIPGCDRPAAWCHAHHHTYWSHGGTTDLANLPFVCTHHHHLIHNKHYTLRKPDNHTWQLTRPDGTPVEPVRYPGRHHRSRPTS
jgi:hypothetical protein